jgi:hypothetical protein
MVGGHHYGAGMGRLAAVDKGSVIGALKATGSRDPDVLYARTSELFSPLRFLKLAGGLVLLAGVPLCFLHRGPFLGIPLILLGWWVRHRAVRNIATIEAGYSEYVNTPAA